MARFRFPFPFPRPSFPRPRQPRRVGLIGAIALLIGALAGSLSQCQAPAAASPAPPQSATTAPSAQTAHGPAKAAPSSKHAAPKDGLQVAPSPPQRWEVLDGDPITDRDEVRAIWDSLRCVLRGPPFPHRQDGVAFENREHRLPQHDSGWWREYTVETTGASTRGARRLVVGSDGVVWYTSDHYRSFVRLVLP